MREEKFCDNKIVLHIFLDAFRYFCFEFLYFCGVSSLSPSKWRNFNSVSLVSNLDKIQITTRFILIMSTRSQHTCRFFYTRFLRCDI